MGSILGGSSGTTAMVDVVVVATVVVVGVVVDEVDGGIDVVVVVGGAVVVVAACVVVGGAVVVVAACVVVVVASDGILKPLLAQSGASTRRSVHAQTLYAPGPSAGTTSEPVMPPFGSAVQAATTAVFLPGAGADAGRK